MKVSPRLLVFLAFALMSLVSTTSATTEQQECQVGEDGTCLAQSDDQMDAAATPTTRKEQPVVEIDEKCPDRDYIVRCAGTYLDMNKNGKLDRHELDEGEKKMCMGAFCVVLLLIALADSLSVADQLLALGIAAINALPWYV